MFVHSKHYGRATNDRITAVLTTYTSEIRKHRRVFICIFVGRDIWKGIKETQRPVVQVELMFV